MNKNRNKTNDEDFSVSIMKHLNIFFKSSFRQALTAKHTPTRHFNLINPLCQDWIASNSILFNYTYFLIKHTIMQSKYAIITCFINAIVHFATCILDNVSILYEMCNKKIG